MRKVIGIGETVLDIIFKEGQPVSAVPGGSAFNAIISLGRCGVNSTFISEAGNDRIGDYPADDAVAEHRPDRPGVADSAARVDRRGAGALVCFLRC